MLETYDAFINRSAATYGVPVFWIKAVIMQESSGNPRAYRAEPSVGDASYGLMQLLYRTALGLGYSGAREGLYDPATNINYGTKLLAEARAKYGDDFQAVYSYYNSGSGKNYITNPSVADHVAKAVSWLERVVTEEPVIATSGAALVVGGLFLWYWVKRKKS